MRATLVLMLAACGGGEPVTLDTAPPLTYDRAPIYYANERGVFRVDVRTHVVERFGAQEPTTALSPSPSRERVAQELAAGRVDVYSRAGDLLGRFDVRPGLLGWRDEDTLVFFDRLGTQTLHVARYDGGGRHDLSERRFAVHAQLSPDGKRALLVDRATEIVSTLDLAPAGTIPAGFDLLWARDGRIVWLEGAMLASADGDSLAITRTPLPFQTCALSPWGGDRVLVYTRVFQPPDVYVCRGATFVTTSGQVLARYLDQDPSAPVALSPDDRKVAIEGGVTISDIDLSNAETLVEGDYGTVLGW